MKKKMKLLIYTINVHTYITVLLCSQVGYCTLYPDIYKPTEKLMNFGTEY